MGNHAFCCTLLAAIMEDVRKHVPVKDRKKAWAYKYTGFNAGTVEFHGPNDFYWHGQGCCKWTARTEGWSAYLRHIGAAGY